MRIGIDLGGTKIECAVLGDRGREFFRRRVPTPRDDYEATLDAIAGLVAEAERDLQGRGLCPSGPESGAGATLPVGIGTPGAISPATGLLKNANSIWLNGRPLAQDLEARLARPIRLANDANCFALSEAVDGAGAGSRVVFGVIIGTGTGGGIVVDGQVLCGPNAVAGEWGHNPLPWPSAEERPGPRCYCGQAGCIEMFLSGPALSRDHATLVSGTADDRIQPSLARADPWSDARILPAAAIARLADEGDAVAALAMERYGERMARALASVINLLDPDVIILGGGMSNVDRLYNAVPRLWSQWVFSDRVDTPLRKARYGDASGVRGAARLWPDRADPPPACP